MRFPAILSARRHQSAVVSPKQVSSEKDRRYHDTIGREYDQVVVEPRKTINDYVMSDVGTRLRPGPAMLDLGCGTGHATLRFSHLFDRVVAVDHSRTMLDVAASNIRAAKIDNAAFVEGNLLTFADTHQPKSFAAIFCIGVLHHLAANDTERLLRRARDLLLKGGQLLISEPRKIGAADLPAEIAEWNSKSIAPTLHYSTHEVDTDEEHISEAQIVQWLYSAGFSLEFITHHWEVFPHSPQPSAQEAAAMIALHKKYGHTGNAMTIIAS